jgi:uncharacterized protein DUF4440
MTAIVLGLVMMAAEQTPRPQVFIEVLLNTLIESQRTFDVRQLDEVLAPDYVEISPLGEVDPRDKVMSFYAPDKKVADPPAAVLDELSTRVYGETAVTIGRVTFQMKGPDGAAARSMRCVFVTRIVNGKWKLVSTQYTPIRK